MNNTYDYGIPLEELRERFSKLYSGLIYDYLENEHHLSNQALANDINPLDSKWVIAGPAYTLKMETTPTFDPSLREYRLKKLDEMVPGMIEVRDCSGDQQVAHFGELNASIMRAKGCIGAIIDGGTRDSRYIRKMDFPVWARYQNPVEALGRTVVAKAMVDITIRGALTTKVTVRPWDYIFADEDGVLIIPREMVKQTLEGCEKEFEQENEARIAYNDPNITPLEIYRKFGKL